MLLALPHVATADDGQNEGAHHQTDHATDHEGHTIRFHIRPSPPFNSTKGCDTLAEGTRTSANLQTQPGKGINTWSDFINALVSGNTYVNVHTTAHTGGEIRGQLVHEQDDENDQVEVTHD